MTHFKTALFTLSVLLLACDKEETAEPEGQELAQREDGHHRGGWMAKFDADKDGAISREEAKGHRIEGKFAELDADGDGKLTREELGAMKGHHGRGKGGWGKDPEERAAHMLARFDADADGAIGRDELGDHPLADTFAEVDSNGDGKLGREELAALKGPGKHGGRGDHGDRGDHGPKDPAERAARMLAKFDANSDGALTADEVADSRLADRFAEADADSDGKLTREELVAFKANHRGDKGRGERHE